MRKSYYPQQYECHQCGKIQSHYVWSDEVENKIHSCIHCSSTLTVHNIHEVEVNAAPGVNTPTKKRLIQRERKIRSQEHFKKEIYPTFAANSHERKHFSKKYGMKS